ncbi:restriction endonuclease [Luteibacter jiangsuensis]
MTTGFKPVDHRYDDALSRVSWDAFERLVAEHYRGLGYEVVHVGTGGGTHRTDGGIDLKLLRGQETVVVQCKHWNCWKVPHNDVHQLIGVMHTAGATGAIVITSGEFTRAAIEAAAKFRHIRLIDGKTVRAMLGPVEEPAMPHTTLDGLPSWIREARRPSRSRAPRGPLVAAAGAVITMTAVLAMLYSYYIGEIHRARVSLLQATLPGTAQATRPGRVPAMPPVLTSSKPMSSFNGRPAIVHDAPMNKADIAAWEKKNAESMRILEKTTPSLP